MKYPLPVLFAIGTAVFWGLYGPTIANARSPAGLWSPFKPYVGIGLAYLTLAIVGGLIAMWLKGDSFTFTGEQGPALKWGFWAGCLGALGALCLTSAMISFGGPPKPHIVMPIVFGGAVTITALVSLRQYRLIDLHPLLFLGTALVVVGICLVTMYTPHGPPSHRPPPDVSASAIE